MKNTTRRVWRNNGHLDIEERRFDADGHEVWAVIKCYRKDNDMTERLNDYACTGWTPPVVVKPATKEQLVALRDKLLREGYTDAAAAVDNALDCIARDMQITRRVEELGE